MDVRRVLGEAEEAEETATVHQWGFDDALERLRTVRRRRFGDAATVRRGGFAPTREAEDEPRFGEVSRQAAVEALPPRSAPRPHPLPLPHHLPLPPFFSLFLDSLEGSDV